MTFLTRLRVLTAVLGAAAASVTVGTYLFGDTRTTPTPAPSRSADRPDGSRVTDELARNRFAQLPTVAYSRRNGETLFAWQVKPEIAAGPARPRDVLVVVDTSASQAGLPLKQARQILQALAAAAGADDRFAVWVLNTPTTTKPLTRDFVAATSDELRNAAAALTEVEYGAGAVDLKAGLGKALGAVPHNKGRNQSVLFLGDGESAYAPLAEADRVALGGQMEADDVAFFAVPLGLKVDPNNLHGLAALTGGAVVRVQENLGDAGQRAAFVARLTAAIDTPILRPSKTTFGPEVAEFFPTKLPPLRADRTTLVLGKLSKPAASVTAKVTGTVGRTPVELALNGPLTPARPEHYFLSVMFDQWKGAPHTDAPAMLQADRALALASTQVKLYRDEFNTQAGWALTLDKVDEAGKLFTAAAKIDPDSSEATAGLKLVERMKAGKLSKADLLRRVGEKANATRIDKNEAVKIVLQEAAATQDPPATAPVPPPAVGSTPAAQVDLLREQAAQRLVQEQRYRVIVDDTIRSARRLLRTDPDAAYQDLKRQRDEVAAYEALGDVARRTLIADLESQMRDIFTKGAEIKRQAAEERERVAAARRTLNELDRRDNLERDTKARLDAFRDLMSRARYELAYQEAQLFIQDRVNGGLPVPPQATATYIIGQQATNLREVRELERIKQDRFLLTMLQTEKSAIPYPDEPPVHFPPATVWRELTAERRDRYLNTALGADPSPTQKAIQSKVENQRVVFEGDLNNFTMFELLQTLSKKYDLAFIINEQAFADASVMGIRDKKPTLTATRLDGLTLGSFLDIVMGSMGASFIVRPDYIEITTPEKRLEEKVTRAFPVGDLVIPIPNSIALSGLQLNLAVQGQTAQNIQQANFLGNLGQALNGNGAALAPGGAAANPNVPNPGGNFLGIQGGGGNVGQFGNLGGQFGIQGATQERELINLIVDTVARGEWKNTQNPNDPMAAPAPEDIPGLSQKAFNSLGYYGPARALLIRGSSRYHTTGSGVLKLGAPMMAAAPNPNGGKVAVAAANPAAPQAGEVARPTVNPKAVAQNAVRAGDKNPKTMWHDVIAATIDDPGVIVAAADFLMEYHEPAHAAEVLKANLRKGLATDAWAHDALAVALQAAGANAGEVERASLSAADLDPADPKAYLRAARAENELKNADRAVAFCKRAADLQPDLPGAYANALVYAERADGGVRTDAVAWAADNLLKRDWPADGADYHAEAKARVARIASNLERAGRKADAAPLQKAFADNSQRDLVVELLWQGTADLDLVVTEPTGAVCDATRRRTTGGGVLRADVLEQTDADGGGRTEVYAAVSAFNGLYQIGVKKVFGTPVGSTATVVVTRFKGTPKETQDVLNVDLRGSNRPLEITLAGGSRTELATVPADDTDARSGTTGAVAGVSSTGLGGGFGPAGSTATGRAETNAGPALPVVNAAFEGRVAGMTGAAADLRTTQRINPDRRTMKVTMTPVFTGRSGAVKMPTVPLLPGADAR